MMGATGGSSRSRRRFLDSWDRVHAWELLVGLLITAGALALPTLGVYQQKLPRVALTLDAHHTVFALDPNHAHTNLTEQITTTQFIVLSYSIPLLAHAVVHWRLPKFGATRDFVLGLVASTAMAQLATNLLKISMGRLRPNFFSMCHWDVGVTPWNGLTNLCRDAAGELEGRQSFPSGHTSCAFSTLGFLSLYLVGRAHTLHQRAREREGSEFHRVVALWGAFLPVLLALWVGVTRYQDRWHHSDDVLGGAVLGAAAAWASYTCHFGLFSPKTSGSEAYATLPPQSDSLVV